MRILKDVLQFIGSHDMDKLSFNDGRSKLICKSDLGLLTFTRTPVIVDFKPTVNFQVLLNGSVVYAYSGAYIATDVIISLDMQFDDLVSKKIASIGLKNEIEKERFNTVFGLNDSLA